MTAKPLPIIVVGASMAGLRACEQLRAAGWDGPLTAIGAETHMPYNRPPLSKRAGGAPNGAQEWLQDTEFRRRASVDDVKWLLGAAVEHADLAAHTVRLADARELNYAGLVIATGLRPRRLPGEQASDVRHVLRTIEDAMALYAQLQPGQRLVVIGGGFIGCEIAVTALSYGCHVTVIEPQAAPMAAVLGSELGGAIEALHTESGIEFRTGAGVSGIVDEGPRATVTLSDGTEITADVVVESVGSHPNVEWLDGNGLDLSNGVLCNEHLAVIGASDAIAVGDIARFPNPRFAGASRRIEHWCMPNDSAKHGARALVSQLTGLPGPDIPFAPLPSFWSDQGDIRLQGYGIPSIADHTEVVAGDLSPDGLRAGIVVEYRQADAAVANVSINVSAKEHAAHRTELTRATDPSPLPTGANA